MAGNVRDLIIGGIAKAKYPGRYLGSLRCCRKNAPPHWCKTVHIGGGLSEFGGFPREYCSCGAVEAFFDDH